MDIATILGLILGVVVMVTSVWIGGSSFSVFFDFSSILCVFGGVLCAVLIGFPMKAVLQLPMVFWKSIANESPEVPRIIEQLVRLAETARREGLLALDRRLNDIRHPFIKLGVQMAVDGTRPEVIEDILRTEMESVAARHALGKSVIDHIGKYAPAFGMIGTLLGLVMMLHNMSDPSNIGSGMAVALLTTLYGAVLANVICLPVSEKLAYYNREEIHSLELIIKGVLSHSIRRKPTHDRAETEDSFASQPAYNPQGGLNMSDEGGVASNVPSWAITFADMMALLFTFFVMLVSFSELKSEEKYQALLDSFQQKFATQKSVRPGELRPRNLALAKRAAFSRSTAAPTFDSKGQHLPRDYAAGKLDRPARQSALRTVLYFLEEQVELDDGQREQLRQQAVVIRGQPKSMEIRGQTSNRRGSSDRDAWNATYERCLRVMDFLVKDGYVDPGQLRITAAVANESPESGTEPLASQFNSNSNSKIQIYLVDEANQG